MSKCWQIVAVSSCCAPQDDAKKGQPWQRFDRDRDLQARNQLLVAAASARQAIVRHLHADRDTFVVGVRQLGDHEGPLFYAHLL